MNRKNGAARGLKKRTNKKKGEKKTTNPTLGEQEKKTGFKEIRLGSECRKRKVQFAIDGFEG